MKKKYENIVNKIICAQIDSGIIIIAMWRGVYAVSEFPGSMPFDRS